LPVHLITTLHDLEHAAGEIGMWSEIGLDTEFDRNRHKYGFNVCMVQVSTPRDIFLIDPLAISPNRAETQFRLEPLWHIVRDNSIRKILHACSEDIRLFDKFQARPFNVFDTRIAAKVLCKSANSFQDLLRSELGVELNKQHQTSNWFKRPLTDEKIDYLAGDVAHLIELKQHLAQELSYTGRLSWFDDEMMTQLDFESVANYDSDIAPVLRKREYNALDAPARYVLRQLWALRDDIARNRDVPPYYVFPDEKMFALASRTSPLQPGQAGKLSPYVNEHRLISIFNQALHDAPEAVQHIPRDYRPRPPRPGPGHVQAEVALELFKPVREALAALHGAEAALLLLPEAAIKRIAFTGNLSPLPRYAQQEVMALADRIPELRRFNTDSPLLHQEAQFTQEGD
jgi:ribonuclease D